MSAATTIITSVPAQRVETPRGAALVGLLANLFVDLAAAHKARREHAAMMRDAAELRRFASSIRNSQPSLSADLFAAADRAI